MNKELIILIGNIGTGKTTYAPQYVKKGYVAIARDTLRYAIGDGKYIYNPQYEPIIFTIERFMFHQFLIKGVNIIVDEVGVSKEMRKHYIEEAKRFGYKITAIEMPHLTMKEAVDRRMNNPHQQNDRKLWEQVYAKFEAMYEEPTKEEGFDEIENLWLWQVK